MMQIIGQMVRMPVSMFTWWMNMLTSTMRVMQQPGWQDPDTANRYASAPRTRVPGAGMHLDNSLNQYGTAPGARFPEAGTHTDNPRAQRDGATNEAKEERKMSDCRCSDHCSDETVKLVEYTILLIKPCEERVLHKGQVVYADDMDDDAFATWIIARYFQGDEDIDVRSGEREDVRYGDIEDKEDSTEAERKKQRAERRAASAREREERAREREERRRRREIPSADKRYLRVYHHVLESWARPDDCCQDTRQLDVLRGIERAIREIRI